jgi:hypothetical protein
MTKATFQIAYDGSALRDGTMDVRDLAPALLAVGQLFDAANHTLNGDRAKVSVHVKATEHGSFSILLEIAQSLSQIGSSLLASDPVVAALNLKEILFGTTVGLIWLTRKLRGGKPDKIERLSADTIRLTFGDESFDVPLRLLRLYQDLAVRDAAERIVKEPLEKPGIDTFKVIESGQTAIEIKEDEIKSFEKPIFEEKALLNEVRKSAFSIVSLAFKDDNKWRLHDGNNQISATISDPDFLWRVNQNELAFAKGDVLVCQVRVKQSQTEAGLKTDYTVEKVIEHIAAPRQLLLDIPPPPKDDGALDT